MLYWINLLRLRANKIKCSTDTTFKNLQTHYCAISVTRTPLKM